MPDSQIKQKPTEYEVIILGSGLGGLIAGTLLLTKARSVLLLMEKGSQSYFRKGGYRFIPFSSLSEKNLKFDLIQAVSQRLGLSIVEREVSQGDEEKKKEKVSFQVILPKSRIDLYQNWFFLRKELKREFPKEIFEIEKFYDEMAKIRASLKGLKGYQSLSLPLPMQAPRPLMKNRFYFERSPFSKEFKRFLQLQLVSYGNYHSDWFPIPFIAFGLLNEETDKSIPYIDLETFKNHIFKKFLDSGGRVEEIERVGRIEMGWRRGWTIFLDEGRSWYHSNILIFNSPLHPLAPLLGGKRKKISKFERKIQPHYLLIPMFLGVQEKVIPVGMGDLLISILDLENSFEGGNLLFLSLSPNGDESMAPEGKRALTVEGLMSFDKWNQGLFDAFKDGVLNHLKRLIPFFEDHLEFIDWEWAFEQVTKWSYSHFIYEGKGDFNWKDGVIPIRMLKNLYLTGKENFPYLGLEGEILSGLKAGEEILKRFQ